jgi:hypothetical protein
MTTSTRPSQTNFEAVCTGPPKPPLSASSKFTAPATLARDMLSLNTIPSGESGCKNVVVEAGIVAETVGAVFWIPWLSTGTVAAAALIPAPELTPSQPSGPKTQAGLSQAYKSKLASSARHSWAARERTKVKAAARGASWGMSNGSDGWVRS